MTILITGICGFVGSWIARSLLEARSDLQLVGIDNLSRPGSEMNRHVLRELGVKVVHADARMPSDFDALPATEWVIDAAAHPSALAGIGSGVTPRQTIEHNLVGTTNTLEHCRRHGSGLILLSSSRVYSVRHLRALPLKALDGAFRLQSTSELPPGCGPDGITEAFPTTAPLSLYGSTKLASEALALEYGEAFRLPVRVVRAGLLTGAGQFGRADQGVVAYWIHSWALGKQLRYIGFGGRGEQVRDCLHPRDLTRLLVLQMELPGTLPVERALCNASGGSSNTVSLQQLSEWCSNRYGAREVLSDSEDRPMDVPWLVLDSARASEVWGWYPETPLEKILAEIADFADRHPNWLATSEGLR